MTEPVRDRQTVTSSGEEVQGLLEGMRIREATLHVDERGSVCEIFDTRWTDFSEDPLVFSYFFTVRPGVVKGWGMHQQHEDRYFLVSGEMELVVYDGREDSPTFGEVRKIYLSEHRRRLVNIPIGVWHADRCIGRRDALVVNFPTIVYDHSSPDKYRLPIDTDEIPHKFPSGYVGG